MSHPRLTIGDITLKDVFDLSSLYYKNYDDKMWRSGLDCTHFYIVQRNNFRYDRSQKKWLQTGREAKLVFKVTSQPISYQKIDTIKKHVYPVTFLLRDISKGINSPFRWRTGSLMKPVFAKKGDSMKKRIKIANLNIRNGIQLDFFF